MLTFIKAKTTKYAVRSSIALNLAVLALAGFTYAAANTGHLRGDIEIVGFSIGGGTEQHAAREQQLAALSAAIPSNALTPAPEKSDASPLPGRKPQVTR